jgi:hypothetical protein
MSIETVLLAAAVFGGAAMVIIISFVLAREPLINPASMAQWWH